MWLGSEGCEFKHQHIKVTCDPGLPQKCRKIIKRFSASVKDKKILFHTQATFLSHAGQTLKIKLH